LVALSITNLGRKTRRENAGGWLLFLPLSRLRERGKRSTWREHSAPIRQPPF
jgi:hypothetical protein